MCFAQLGSSLMTWTKRMHSLDCHPARTDENPLSSLAYKLRIG